MLYLVFKTHNSNSAIEEFLDALGIPLLVHVINFGFLFCIS